MEYWSGLGRQPGLDCIRYHIQWIRGSSVAHLPARGFSREGFHIKIKCRFYFRTILHLIIVL